jgi:hypothetical protein
MPRQPATTSTEAPPSDGVVRHPRPHLIAVPALPDEPAATGEDGSLVAEYGLLAVVAATMSGVLIMWARGDALTGFFTALLDHARNLVVG